jgi:hypothetical protein
MTAAVDPRTIHISSKTYLTKVRWDRPFDGADSEWVYFGAGKELDLSLIQIAIDQHLQSEELLLDLGRHLSRPISREEMIREFSDLIAVSNLTVWDPRFHSVIEFAKMGVFRKGGRPTLIPT